MNESWRTFVDHDRSLTAPPYLEDRVLRAVAAGTLRRPRLRNRLMAFAGAAAAMLIAIAGTQVSFRVPPPPINARPLWIAARPAAVPSRTAARRIPVPADKVRRDVPPGEPPLILVMFDFVPAIAREPLQLVRLRVPREALQELGVPLLEPDATGMIDLDMLVGEDGLPRDIRRIRQGQEDR
jgi:hypothetical protein